MKTSTVIAIVSVVVAAIAGLGIAIYMSTKKAVDAVKDVKASVETAKEGTSGINKLANEASVFVEKINKLAGFEE